MKRIIILTLAIICGVAFSESFAKKPKKSKMTEMERQAQLDSLRMEMELRELERERKRDSIQALMDALEREQNMRRAKLQPEMEEIPLPCQEEAKSDEEYYKALGISGPHKDSRYAIQDAMQNAQMELANQVKEKEVDLENAEMVCRQISRDDFGNYIAYIALSLKK